MKIFNALKANKALKKLIKPSFKNFSSSPQLQEDDKVN